MAHAGQANLLPTHTPQLFTAAVAKSAELLRQGEVVALPTETVYGLAANAFDERAVERIYEIKGRPPNNPIIVHIASLEMAKRCVSDWPLLADKLAKSFWPGPLTLVLPRSKEIPDVVTAAGPTVGIRWPSHPFIQAVIAECGFPLAAPSANPANQLSPTNATHVQKFFGDKLKLIVDGGQSQIGIESTVLDLSVSPPQLLRPGMIHEPALLSVTGELATSTNGHSGILKSPGQLPKHYSPKAKLLILSWKDDHDLQTQLARHASRITHHASSIIHVISHARIPSASPYARVSVIPHDPEAFARAIYAELHQCDDAGAQFIVVEAPPKTPEWGAIADRLNRAAA